MKATRIRAFLAAPAVAAVLGLGTYIAYADSVRPTGNATASSSNVTIKLGTATVTCTSSTAHFDAQSSTSGQPVCGTLSSAPTLTGCTVSASGFRFSATCSTSGTWSLCASSSNTASLTIPEGGVTCTANILGQTCRATATTAGTGSKTITGTWTDGDGGPPPNPPPPPTPGKATFTNQSIPTTTSGGFPCPSGTSSSFSATYNVTNDATGAGLLIDPN